MAATPGSITITRHGEPALSRKCLLTAQQYRDWWAQYEVGGLRAGQTPPPALVAAAEGAGAIYASTRRRALETAKAAAAGKEVMVDALFIEAPLPPPRLPDWFKLPPKYWGAVARVWWHAFNHHEGQETRAQAEMRAGIGAAGWPVTANCIMCCATSSTLFSNRALCTSWPRPVFSRCASAAITPMAPNMPPMMSLTEAPARSGSPGRPVM